jgi:hypothetical protein
VFIWIRALRTNHGEVLAQLAGAPEERVSAPGVERVLLRSAHAVELGLRAVLLEAILLLDRVLRERAALGAEVLEPDVGCVGAQHVEPQLDGVGVRGGVVAGLSASGHAAPLVHNASRTSCNPSAALDGVMMALMPIASLCSTIVRIGSFCPACSRPIVLARGVDIP